MQPGESVDTDMSEFIGNTQPRNATLHHGYRRYCADELMIRGADHEARVIARPGGSVALGRLLALRHVAHRLA